MPYLNGRRVTLAEWRAANPVGPLYLRDEFGNRHTVKGTEVEDDPETYEEYASQQRRRVTENPARLAAIADVLGVAQDSPELAAVEVVPVKRDLLGNRLMPWDDGTPATPEDALALDMMAAMDEVRQAREAQRAELPAEERGKVGQGQAEAFARSKGFVSKRTRPSQTPEGRRRRFLAADVKRGHCSSLAQAAQKHPPKKPKSPKDPS